MEREQQDWICRTMRRPVNLPGTARRQDGVSIRELMSNLSYQGCHLWTEGEVTVGETLELCVKGMGLLDAQVRWVSSYSVGLKFLTGDSAADSRRARIGV